jgi:hypothetical protein
LARGGDRPGIIPAGCQNRDEEPRDSELTKSTVTTRSHSAIKATVRNTFQLPAATVLGPVREGEGEGKGRGRGRSKKEKMLTSSLEAWATGSVDR